MIFNFSDTEPSATPEPSAEPTPEPTAEPSAEPSPTQHVHHSHAVHVPGKHPETNN